MFTISPLSINTRLFTPSPEAVAQKQLTTLHETIKTGDLNTLSRDYPLGILETLVNQPGDERNTALHYAADLEGDKPAIEKIIEKLFEAGADIGVKNNQEQTPLHIMALARKFEALQLWVEDVIESYKNAVDHELSRQHNTKNAHLLIEESGNPHLSEAQRDRIQQSLSNSIFLIRKAAEELTSKSLDDTKAAQENLMQAINQRDSIKGYTVMHLLDQAMRNQKLCKQADQIMAYFIQEKMVSLNLRDEEGRLPVNYLFSLGELELKESLTISEIRKNPEYCKEMEQFISELKVSYERKNILLDALGIKDIRYF